MLINLLHTIKDWAHHSCFSSYNDQRLYCQKEGDLMETSPSSLGFHPKPMISTPHIFKCSLQCTLTACIQLCSCENIFFVQKYGFCPSSPETWCWPTDSRWQKGQKFTLLPPCPDVIRSCPGNPFVAEQAIWAFVVVYTAWMAATQALSSCKWADSWTTLWIPLSLLALKLVSRDEPRPRRTGRTPGTELGISSLWECLLKTKFSLLSFWGATGRQHSWWLFL